MTAGTVSWQARGWQSTRDLLPRAADWHTMRRQPTRDLLAGCTVAMVALPLALAFGITSGLGARAGLITAVVAGLLAAVFGGSNLQVSGPTGAMTVVLLPVVSRFGAEGVLVAGLLAGLVLPALAYAKVGRYIQFVPLPVVEGFTVGIAVIIGLQQVPAILGVSAVTETGGTVLETALDSVRRWAADPHWVPLVLAFVVAGSMLLAVRFRPGLPVSLVAVAVATIVITVAHSSIQTIGQIPAGFPAPAVPHLAASQLGDLLVPAVAIAALAALESLLCASVADGMTVGEHHDPSRELFGQGMANLVCPWFGGIPATAAIARTAVNVRAGARSRLAALTQSGVLLLVMLGLSGLVSYIPLAALAGVLLATIVQMVEVSSVRALLRSTRGDAVVLVVTAVATIALNLVTAVIIGLVTAGAFAVHQMAGSARLDEVALDVDGDQPDESSQSLLDEHIVAYRLEGPLFFGAAHTFLLELTEISDVSVVILRMSRVASLDATGASVLGDIIKRLEGRGVTVLVSGVRDRHHLVLERLGVYGELAHERHVFASTPEAIAHARVHAARLVHVPGGAGDVPG